MAVWALTGLLAVHVYSPASPRLPGLMTREPPEMVILESAVMVAPPLPHWTVISVPAVHVHLRDIFLPSTATVGTDTLTPATASTGKAKKYFIKEQQMQNYPEKVSDGTIVVGIGHTAHESAHFKSWSDNTIQGSFMFLLRIICCNQSK